jgi:hypothetical protein
LVEFGLPLLESTKHGVKIRRLAKEHLLHLAVNIPQRFQPLLRRENWKGAFGRLATRANKSSFAAADFATPLRINS